MTKITKASKAYKAHTLTVEEIRSLSAHQRHMYLYTLTRAELNLVTDPCVGDAHSNPYIDNCMVCLGTIWGRMFKRPASKAAAIEETSRELIAAMRCNGQTAAVSKAIVAELAAEEAAERPTTMKVDCDACGRDLGFHADTCDACWNYADVVALEGIAVAAERQAAARAELVNELRAEESAERFVMQLHEGKD